MHAWIDPDWHDGDGIIVVFAATAEEASVRLDMDYGAAESYAPADGMQDLPLADLYAYLLMLGWLGEESCAGCRGQVFPAYQHEPGKNISPVGYPEWREGEDEPEMARPVRVEGLGLFCSWDCWRRYADMRCAP